MTYQIKSIKNAIRVLSLFNERNIEYGVHELSRKTQMHKSTIHRILVTLEKEGFLQKSLDKRKYRLGYKLYELGNLVVPDLELKIESEPFLEELLDKTQETVHLTIHEGGEALYINKLEGPQKIRVASRIGGRLPLHCSGVGKVLLAHMEDLEVENIIREKGLCKFTRNTITNPVKLKRELKKIREVGFAIDNEEIELGLKCIASPIRDHSGKVIASVSISGPSVRMTDNRIPLLSQLVMKTAKKVSQKLGYQ